MFAKCVRSARVLVPAAACLAVAVLPSSAQQYQMTPLVSDQAGVAAVTDPNLVNAWGLSRSSGSDWWISDNATGKSTLYNGTTGAIGGLVVTIPAAQAGQTGSPTGTIFNGSKAFQVANGAPAVFLFSTEDGTISGWNPGANFGSAIIKVKKDNAVYKGITAADLNGLQYLYVTNFRTGQIEMYDPYFRAVKLAWNAFNLLADNTEGDPWSAITPAQRNYIANAGFVPYNIQNIGGALYVTYAQPDSAKHDSVSGPGLGAVAAFTPAGKLIRVFEIGKFMNAPWGLALASSDFGLFSHTLLVGQFGSGEIVAFNLATGKYTGTLLDASGKPIAIDGLWGISFGNGADSGGPMNTLFFGAGPVGETHGLFGAITALPSTLTEGNDQ